MSETEKDIVLDAFLASYIETALWSSTDDDGNPLDDQYYPDDISAESLEEMRKDCAEFLEQLYPILEEIGDYQVSGKRDIDNVDMAARDFWLTRNEHGAGFWDGDWPEPHDEKLTEIAKSFGECNLYIGDDGKIYSA